MLHAQEQVQRQPLQQEVEAVLERFRPNLAIDGCGVECLGLAGGLVRLRFTGSMHCCPMAQAAVAAGLEDALRRVLPGLRVAFV